MIREFEEFSPQIDPSAFVDSLALVLGQVSIGADSSIWPMAVLRGDVHEIEIGSNTSIQDGSVCHVTHQGQYHFKGYPLKVGSNVTVGHKVTLHGCDIHDNCLVGIGSIVLDGAIIESDVILGAGSLVPVGKVLEGGYLWLGQPARKIRPLRNEEKEMIAYSAQHYVKLKNKHKQAGS